MYIHHKWKINVSIIPIFLFSSIICLVFSAGLLNFMPHMVYGILISGIFLFGYYVYLYIRKEFMIKDLFLPSIVFFIFISFVITLLLKGMYLLDYDNFSHWGLIVKEMFEINSLPDSRTIIQFRNYPPGSAVFIYFIGKILGPSESHALMAQGYLLAANLAVLFVFYKWKDIFSIVLSVVISMALMLVISAQIYNLLVDTLLGVVALAICIIAYYYRDNWVKCVLVNLPLLSVLILIKDSGKIFFVFNIAIIIWLIISNIKRKEKKQRAPNKNILMAMLLILLVPLFVNFLWLQYIDKAYPAQTYESNKFALSTDKLTNVEKSDELISNLGPKLLQASADLNSINFFSIFLLNIVALLLILGIYIRTRRISKLLLYSIIFSDLCYILYIFSLYLMYLFLMPEGEASYLAGFSRYQSTIIIFCIGLIMTAITLEHANGKSKVLKIGLTFVLSFIYLYPFKENLHSMIIKPDVNNSIRLQVKNEYDKIASTGVTEPKVLYYSPQSKNDSGYLYFVLMYEQLSHNYSIIKGCTNNQEKENLLSVLKESNFLVILDKDENFTKCFSPLLDVADPKGVYEIKNIENKLSVTPL